MKRFLIVIFIFSFSAEAIAQEKDQPSNSFSIEGNIRNPYSVNLAAIAALPKYDIGDFAVKNHLGVEKSKVSKAKGVLLRDLLKNAVLDTDQPKIYSEYYLVLTASDGYKVVFSWNELFNSPAGDKVFVLTEMNGAVLEKMPGRIAVISMNDTNNGRRFVKGLAKIKIVHAEF